jgi:YegS/Rv2252/BmrU family lipid kinase
LHVVDITRTKYSGHAIDIAREANGCGFDIIVAVGGDGTVNEIINGTIGSNIPIGIIPYGTANDLASYLGIPKDIEKACDLINNANVRSVDLIKVNNWFFITSGGIGLPCDVLAEIKNSKRQRIPGRRIFSFLGGKIYALALLMVLLKRKHYGRQIKLRAKNHLYNIEVSSLVIGNQPYLGRSFKVLPGAINNDGAFDVCIIENSKNRIRFIITLIKTLTGNHIKNKDVTLFRTNNISIKSDKSLEFFGDGELGLKDTSFNIQIIPGGAKIIAPVAC